MQRGEIIRQVHFKLVEQLRQAFLNKIIGSLFVRLQQRFPLRHKPVVKKNLQQPHLGLRVAHQITARSIYVLAAGRHGRVDYDVAIAKLYPCTDAQFVSVQKYHSRQRFAIQFVAHRFRQHDFADCLQRR